MHREIYARSFMADGGVCFSHVRICLMMGRKYVETTMEA